MSGSEQPIAAPLADSAGTQVNMLAAPEALHGKKLRLGKKVTYSRTFRHTYSFYSHAAG